MILRRTTFLRVRPPIVFALAALVLAALAASLLVPGRASAAAGTSAVPGTSAAAGASTAGAPAPELPKPTGRLPVGMAPLHLVDAERADPWRPAERRELMVSLWYPAVPNGRPAPYTSEAVSAANVRELGLPVPADIMARVRTHAYDRAVALPGKRPLIVLSPGGGLSRESLTALAEDLASRGYVVAGVDHTYEATAIEFPDGRVAPCVACEYDLDRELGAKISQGRAKDVSLVLDRLTARRLWAGAPSIDKRRIGMAGHSLGGASSATTMRVDPRVDAGVNMDGTFFEPVPSEGVDRPFLMFGGRPHEPGSADETWPATWSRLTGARRWLQIPTADHMSFSDRGTLADQLNVPFPEGTIPGDRAIEVTRAYVGAWFGRHLMGRTEPLLDAPSPAYPEVTFRA